MRLIVLLVLLCAYEEAPAELLPPYVGAELVEEGADKRAARHLVVLGSLEKVNHVVQPEQSTTFKGLRSWETYYLPQARRTRDVADHYSNEIEQLGELKFSCRGRTCGSSSYWANSVFEQAILYGPEQYQYYFIVELPDGGGYTAVYVGQRATRKIYVYIESIKRHSIDMSMDGSKMPRPDVTRNRGNVG